LRRSTRVFAGSRAAKHKVAREGEHKAGPRLELRTFLVTIEEVVDLARGGDVADAYEAPLAGVHRAEGIRDDGVEWGAELVTRYLPHLPRGRR
jgi:hypothetical protein